MREFREQVLIAATPARVWSLLADIGAIQDWCPAVSASSELTSSPHGCGARRRCEFGKFWYTHEFVSSWQAGRVLELNVVSTNLPLRVHQIRFALGTFSHPHETVVDVHSLYALYGGRIATGAESMFHRRYRGLAKQSLRALKQYLEHNIE